MKLYTIPEIVNLSKKTKAAIYRLIHKKHIKPYSVINGINHYTDLQMYMILGVIVKYDYKVEVIKQTKNWLILESKMNRL